MGELLSSLGGNCTRSPSHQGPQQVESQSRDTTVNKHDSRPPPEVYVALSLPGRSGTMSQTGGWGDPSSRPGSAMTRPL